MLLASYLLLAVEKRAWWRPLFRPAWLLEVPANDRVSGDRGEVGVLRLEAAGTESLWDELLPAEVKLLPADLEADASGHDATLRSLRKRGRS